MSPVEDQRRSIWPALPLTGSLSNCAKYLGGRHPNLPSCSAGGGDQPRALPPTARPEPTWHSAYRQGLAAAIRRCTRKFAS
jgi:hypothetical protein